MNFDEDIKRITEEVIQDGTLEQIVREKVINGFSEAVDSAFRWGDLNEAIKKRVKETLVPIVESYDMSDFAAKLDMVLVDIVSHTSLVDNKKILGNFQELMTDPEKKQITLEEIFKEYNKFVAENVETYGLDVIHEDEPVYEAVETCIEIEEEENGRWYTSYFDHAHLNLRTDGNNNDDNEKLGFHIRLSRWKQDKEPGWEIDCDFSPNVMGLSRISDFEVFLLKLQRAGVRIVDTETYAVEDVTPNQRPEATYE